MVSRPVNLILRGLEFFFTLLVLSLIGAIIAQAFSGNPSIINYDMFVAVFGMLSLFYLIAVAWSDSFQVHPILPVLMDALNVIFFFCGAVATAAELGAHSCSNSSYTLHNKITNGASNTKGRCQEAQAATAFLFFAWACFTASLFFSLLDARGGSVNLRGGIRKGGPAMRQV